ncbi:MAG: hypothetical protein IJQ63_00355 [Synergistaceae bacterium]|nr:hypothetical protein [Synergistaceae bacterium]MBR0220204.1 hypothetical protein [Synergistaceae bacterium]
MTKIYDLAVRTGQYMTRSGETKSQWLNIGAVMRNDKRESFILLNRSFNPAGVPVKDSKAAQIIVSLFKPKGDRS